MKVLLVDGSALAYRSFYAFVRSPLFSSRGEPTSLVFGCVNTLLRWLQRYAPGAAAVVFDPPGPTHRHRLYPDYKVNRPPRPAGLDEQMPRLLQALAALRVAVVEVGGWEADDVLATLARHFEARGDDVYLASGDKDFRQLLSARVRLLRPLAGEGGDEELGPAELARDCGLEPGQIVDLMALVGDAVDNVPGVRGIGDKTAAQLIRAHGSLEVLYAKLDALERQALREKLAAGRGAAFLARDLVRLRTDAPLDCEAVVPAWPGADWRALGNLLRELELFGILRQLPPERAPTAGAPCTAIRTEAELEALVETLRRQEAVAIHLDPDAASGTAAGLAALGFASAGGEAWGLRLAATPPPPPPGQLDLRPPQGPGMAIEVARRLLAPLFGDPHPVKIAQDAKRVARRLEREGMPLAGPYRDTMVAAYVLNPERRRYDLETLGLEFLDEHPAPERDADPASERVERAAGRRATLVRRLHGELAARLGSEGLESLFATVEMPVLGVLCDMERAGVQVDVAALQDLSRDLLQRATAVAERIYALAGRSFNLQSPPQLGQVLFAELGLPHGRRTQSGWSTEVDVLERLAAEHEIVRLVLEHRLLSKLRSTYAEALPRLVDPQTGRIHTSFNQAVASTGRLSSSEPNLQNIPARTELGRRIRAAFVPREPQGRLVSADYSQIELRLMAHLSGDPALVAAFAQGGDVHRLTAARIAGCDPAQVTPAERAAAKTVNFGVIYGMGPRGLAERLGIPAEEARRFIDDYFASYPGVRRCIDDLIQQARASGHATTLLGRRLRLPDITSDQPVRRAAAERLAVNAPIQGSAADLVKLAMVRVHARLGAAGLRTRLVLQVHDELLFDVPADEIEAVVALAREEMQAALPLRVPVVVDVGVGRNWAEAH